MINDEGSNLVEKKGTNLSDTYLHSKTLQVKTQRAFCQLDSFGVF